MTSGNPTIDPRKPNKKIQTDLGVGCWVSFRRSNLENEAIALFIANRRRKDDFFICAPVNLIDFWLFWFLCGNEVYTDSFFDKIVLKVLPDKHFTIP